MTSCGHLYKTPPDILAHRRISAPSPQISAQALICAYSEMCNTEARTARAYPENALSHLLFFMFLYL